MSFTFSNNKLVDQFVEDCIRPMFPNGSIMSSSSGIVSADAINPPIRSIDFNQNNKSYVGSSYSYSGVHKFLHYTSLKGLLGILDSKQLRLYNLKYMDDPHEVSYVLEKLEIAPQNQYLADRTRDGFYCLSMIEPRVEKSESSLDVWRRYGDDGRGVAIELEFQKSHISHWVQYHLSRVYYGDKELSKLIDWWSGCNDFMKLHSLKLDNLEKAFNVVRACHKKAIYRSEREVRLIYSIRGNTHFSDYKIDEKKLTNPSIHFDVSGNRKPTDYHTLEIESKRWKNFKPIKGFNVTQSEIKKIYPQVKIKRIIFGYRISKEDAGKLHHFIRFNLDQKVQFHYSPLRRYFTNDFNEKQFYGYKDPTHKSKSTEL